MRVILLCLIIALLYGCTVKYPVVGTFADRSDTLYGTVTHNLALGTAYIQIQGKETKIKCSGTSQVIYIPPISYILPVCKGQKGVAILNCDDSRVIDAEWESISCTTGIGTGADKKGDKFKFVFGMEESNAIDYLNKEFNETIITNPTSDNEKGK
ncbi:MAG TPA: hypothetical protein DHU69_08690 [Deltaproteobacteria bacterium]|nr:MAG: hypothetical protein A2090_07415 [Deltaproteobacteria bacterium GWD2_42_10]HAG49882.1 hypothetical protein [Deltaproteobacteria bacterium]HCY19807.1 hypothetical protein [Deltaproteobacteria bacterium]